jgi:hypothetical protein
MTVEIEEVEGKVSVVDCEDPGLEVLLVESNVKQQKGKHCCPTMQQ